MITSNVPVTPTIKSLQSECISKKEQVVLMTDIGTRNKKEPKAPDWLIENIAEASKNARKIYLLYIGLLAYCALTIVSTTDRQLVLNDVARLPIINVEVPLNGFFILSPLLMLFVFIYFQLYLNKLKRLCDELNADYSTGKPSRIYPWMLNFADELKSNFIGKVQRFIVNFSLWFAMPIVLLLNSLWYIKKHAPVLSYVVGMLPLIGTIIVILFWNYYEFGRGKCKAKKQLQLIRSSTPKSMLVIAVAVIEMVLLFIFIPFSFDGDVSDFIRPLLCVDLSYQKLVTEENVSYNTLHWVNLQGVHLEGADLTGAILKRADLKKAQLKKAWLLDAQLQGAELTRAQLDNAVLARAQLQGADLRQAQLDSAHLNDARLDSADLSWAKLQGAWLQGVNLQGGSLVGSQSQGINLSDAKLQGANLRNAKLDRACLDETQLQRTNFGYAQLKNASLFGAKLNSANLSFAQLQGAELAGAQFDNALLWLTNLKGAKHLTIEQLSKVKTLYQAELDSALAEQVKNLYPHLLQEPDGRVLHKIWHDMHFK